MKFFKIFILVVVIITSFTACGSSESNSSDSIVGQWIIPDEIENAGSTTQLVYLEFFSDGTYASNRSNYSGNYSIDGDRIKLEGILVDPLVATFELEDNNLTFYYDDGDVMFSYQRSV